MSEEQIPPTPPVPAPVPPAAVQPNLPLEVLIDKSLDKHINHNRYRNTVAVVDTQLMELFPQIMPHVEEIHRRILIQCRDVLAASRRSGDGKPSLSRTNHNQLAAIVNRYIPILGSVPILHPEDPEPRELFLMDLQRAVEQADKIEVRAKQMVDALSAERTMGNIQIVKDTTGPGKRKAVAAK
jgi:hypothetical protein